MAIHEFKTRAPKSDRPEGWVFESALDIPEDMGDFTEFMGGEENVKNLALAQFTVKYQGAVRTLAESGKTDEEIVAFMESWKIGDSIGLPKDPVEKARAAFAGLSPEKRAELLAVLAASQA